MALYEALYYKDPHPLGTCTLYGSAARAALWLYGSTGLFTRTSPIFEHLRTPPSPTTLKLTPVWPRPPAALHPQQAPGDMGSAGTAAPPSAKPSGRGASQSSPQPPPGKGIQVPRGDLPGMVILGGVLCRARSWTK